MNNFVILFVIALCGTSSSLNVERTINRIIGGLPANENQFPYTISLQQLSQVTNYTRGHRCGGALVTLRHAVTSASCLYNNVNGVHTLIAPNEYRVFAGAVVLTNDSSADRHRTVESFTVHPNFSPGTPHVNDIAVITLTTAFPSSAVSTVPMSINDATSLQGPICTSSGWGSQNNTNSPSTQLMYLQKSVLEQAMCELFYTGPGAIANTTLTLQDTMVCATTVTSSSSCSGDSGNPLVCNGNLNGILTVNGHNCSSSIDLRPEVYTRVSRFATWINSTTDQTPTTTTTPATTPATTLETTPATTPTPSGAFTFQPGMAVLAVIAIVQIITANVNSIV